MNPDLRVQIEQYIESLFVAPDPVLKHNINDAGAAGLPAHPGVAEPGEAALPALEDVPRIARARDRHARRLQHDVAGASVTRGRDDHEPRVGSETRRRGEKECRSRRSRCSRHHYVGPAEQTLQRLIDQQVPPFDLIFIHADKPGYPRYLELWLRLSRPGTVILADNLIREGHVLDEGAGDENARAARVFNAILAADQARVDHHFRPREEGRRHVDLDR